MCHASNWQLYSSITTAKITICVITKSNQNVIWAMGINRKLFYLSYINL